MPDNSDMMHPAVRAAKFDEDFKELEAYIRDIKAKYENLIQVTLLFGWIGDDRPNMPGALIVSDNEQVTAGELATAGLKCVGFGSSCIEILIKELAKASKTAGETESTDEQT